MPNQTISHNFFSVKKQYSFIVDNTILFDFYKPMVGIDAANLYIYLANEVDNQAQKPSKSSSFTEFLTHYGMSESNFVANRKKLEAAGLLDSFFSVEKNQYFFIINQVLSPAQFFSNNKFISLLKSRLTPAEYEKLIYIYTDARPFVSDITEISENFDFLCENKKVFAIDYDAMIKLVSAKTKGFFAFNDSSKTILDKFSSTLNNAQMLDIIFNSLIQKDNYHTIDDEKLLDIINAHFSAETVNNSTVKQQFVRNTNIFRTNNKVSLQEKKEIFESYKNASTVDFLRYITKQEVTVEQCNWISQTLKECPREILNLTFDYYYSMKKPRNWKGYCTKVLQTIFQKNLLTCESLLSHLDGSLAKKDSLAAKDAQTQTDATSTSETIIW